MARRRLARLAWIVPLTLLATLARGQGDETAKKPLDHDAYDRWVSIQGQRLSDDGGWALYTLRPGKPKADITLVIDEVDGDDSYRIVRGTSARFAAGGRHAIYLIEPDPEEVEEAQKKGKKQGKKGTDHLPKKTLELLALPQGTATTVARVKSFELPEESGDWVAYLLEKPLETPEPGAEKQVAPAAEAEAGEEPASEPESKPEPAAEGDEQPDAKKKEKSKDRGTELVVRDLRRGAEIRFADVVEYAFSEDGSRLAFATSAEAAEDDGVFVLEPGTSEPVAILSGRGHYKRLVFDESGQHLAFLTDRDDYEAKKPSWAVHAWSVGDGSARLVAREGTEGIPEGWWVADSGAPSFSRTGRRLFFETRPRPEEDEDEADDDEGETEATEEEEQEAEEPELPPVKLDVWHWRDPELQPMQLIQARRDRNRSYTAVAHLAEGTIVQLEDEHLESVSVADEGEGDVGLGLDDRPYRTLISWDYPGYQDVYLVDVRTGERTLALENLQGGASLSPLGKYVTWFNLDDRHWHAMSVKTLETVNLTELLPHPVHNELHDQPSPAGSYGNAGWVEGDVAFIVYDRYDAWLTNPSGFFPPSCITDSWGREHEVRLRRVRLDPEERAIDPAAAMLLSAFDERTKASGFCRDAVRGTNPPRVLVMNDERLSTPRKADDADRLLLTRQTFRMFPDLWVTDLDFDSMTRISDANPQQSEYLWGSARLYEWRSIDGEPLRGILYTPEGFDPEEQHPMLVYFYERNSRNLHRYWAPAGSRSIVNISFYVSRGYVMFVPDIPYEIGAPGQSAVNAVLPGVTALIDEGFVDPQRIGVQGHSWGGYQIAYMVTKTDMFACAESGAPVSNMTSAYGGIRWGSGMSRMFQYEKTQSRIGGTLWDRLQYYIENSPIFWADRITTPLLILHNDEDGAVPWYQGIELFVALRRLGKPAWMLNYNDEAHGLRKLENQRDFAVRMQQFFDHYLKDAPAPVWLAEGVPAKDKGKSLGLELVEQDSPQTHERRAKPARSRK